MKRFIGLLCLLLAPAAGATTAVTGKIQTLGAGNVTSGAFARFWLRGCAGNQPTVSGTAVIGPTQGGVFFFDIAVDASGNTIGTLYSTRDSTGVLGGDISCGGSTTAVWYGMQIFVAGKGGPEVPVHAKNSVTLDISSVTPITTNPVITSPTGDATYVRLDGTNGPGTGNLTFKKIESIRYADQFASVQAAINDLPTGATGGGTVIIPPGSYTCPTSIPSGVTLMNLYGWGSPVAPPQIWSKFNGAAFNSQSAGVGSQNMVRFTGCTLNLTDVSQIGILGIVLDYNNAANMTIKGVSWSQFAMAIVNVPITLPAVNFIGDTPSVLNSSNDHFYYLVTEGGNAGMTVGATSGNAATVNEFDWVLNLIDTQPAGAYIGIGWVGVCDSNRVHRHSVFTTNVITNFIGEKFNTTSTTVDTDADSIVVDWYEETMNGSPASSTSLFVNPSVGNIVTTGVTQSTTQIVNTAWAGHPNGSPFTWHETGQVVGTGNVEQANIYQSNSVLINTTLFANLGAIGNGFLKYCSDCTIANPCAGGGTGALAKRLNGVWVCN